MPEHQQIQQSKKSDTIFQKQATPVIQTPVSNPDSIIQRAKINPKSLTHADIMQLQRTIGNRAVGVLLSGIGNASIAQQVTVQRQEIPEEEEPLQGKFESVQRQEIPEEEEPLQGKMIEPLQLQEIPEEEEPLQGKFESIQRQEIPEEEKPLQTKRENNTGMPDNLKAGVESLSGIDMSDVKVHYNSDKPAEVGALAYTQGTNIHVAPGQEKHLPHEAWHVVQQAQGRVKPTVQLKGVAVNDDEGLEHEADVIGVKLLQIKYGRSGVSTVPISRFAQRANFEMDTKAAQIRTHSTFNSINSCPIQCVTEEEIKTRAYFIWIDEGRPEGRDKEHYFRAKRELEAQEQQHPSQAAVGQQQQQQQQHLPPQHQGAPLDANAPAFVPAHQQQQQQHLLLQQIQAPNIVVQMPSHRTGDPLYAGWTGYFMQQHLLSTGYMGNGPTILITAGMHMNFGDQLGPHYQIDGSFHVYPFSRCITDQTLQVVWQW
ncbi:MAG: hypothetical protein QG646_2122 [Euryarchaeota archaeon]|nr:hypothetical protein [Euryarchaeota archaeon]